MQLLPQWLILLQTPPRLHVGPCSSHLDDDDDDDDDVGTVSVHQSWSRSIDLDVNNYEQVA